MSDYMDYLSKFKIEFRRVETDYEWHYALKYNVNILSLWAMSYKDAENVAHGDDVNDTAQYQAGWRQDRL